MRWTYLCLTRSHNVDGARLRKAFHGCMLVLGLLWLVQNLPWYKDRQLWRVACSGVESLCGFLLYTCARKFIKSHYSICSQLSA